MPNQQKGSQRRGARRPARDRYVWKPVGATKPKTKRDARLKGTVLKDSSTIKFRRRDVRVVKLKDSNGDVVGISFPSRKDDRKDLTRWANRAERTADKTFIPNYQSDDEDEPTKFKPTPWATQSKPFYVHAHADPGTFDITVKTKEGKRKRVEVDGRTHGRIVNRNKYFRRAAKKDPTRPVVYMSCESGAPSGDAARRSAAYLHSKGRRSTVYAPTGDGVRPDLSKKDRTSWYAVERPSGGGEGTFSSFPPPSS